MNLELNIEKTIIPPGLKIRKETVGDDTWRHLNKPVRLPFDKDFVSKVKNIDSIPRQYFLQVIKSFLEDILPETFPKDFYKSIDCDDYDMRYDNIHINPQPNNAHHYSINVDLSTVSQEDINRGKRVADVQTSILLSSTIYNASAGSPITNGYNPRIVDGTLAPVDGISIRLTWAYIALPNLQARESNDGGHFYTELYAPVLQTLLTESPLFFPTTHPIRNTYHNGLSFPALWIKDTDIKTINNALTFREELTKFTNKNYSELRSIVKDFSSAKHEAGINSEKSIENYTSEFLYNRFHKVNRRIEDFRLKLPKNMILDFDKLYKEKR
ncbi:MAG: hypothetical protein ACP5N2_04580 [Candidatus Nanoarchaeia archaeon]